MRWLVFEQTHSEFMLGIVEVASLMPGLLVGLFAGALADRVAPLQDDRAHGMRPDGRWRFVLALLVWLDVFQVWQLALILALARICVTFELPSRQVFFFDLVGPENLSNAIALNSGLFNATRVVGPALAGVGLSMLGAAGCFALNGLSYLAAIAAVLSIRLAHARARSGAKRFTPKRAFGRAGLPAGPTGGSSPSSLLVAFFGFVGMGYEAMVPAYAQTVVETGVYGYSVLLACSGIGATAGAFVVASLGGLRAQGAADDRGHGHFRRLPRGGGALADALSARRDRLAPGWWRRRPAFWARASARCSSIRRR